MDKAKIASAFGDAAIRYNEYAQVQQLILGWSLTNLPRYTSNPKQTLSAPSSIVDLGCGTGRALPALSELAENVIALDIAQPMLDVAAQNNAHLDNIQYQCADFDQLSQHFAPHSIEQLFSSMSLQWSASPQALLDSIAGVLAKTGCATLTILIAPSFSHLKLAWSSIGRSHAVHDFISLTAWLTAAQNANFIVDYQQETFIDVHPDFSSMLHSIKGVGAHRPVNKPVLENAPSGPSIPLTKHQLKQAETAFLNVNDGVFSLDYHVVQLHLRHRT